MHSNIDVLPIVMDHIYLKTTLDDSFKMCLIVQYKMPFLSSLCRRKSERRRSIQTIKLKNNQELKLLSNHK